MIDTFDPLLSELFHHFTDIARFGDIRFGQSHLHAGFRCDKALQIGRTFPLILAVVEDQVIALLRQFFGDRHTNATACAGNEYGLSL
ncbi:hypothetical protein D3C75_1122130 [compost metagenome]